MYRNFFKRIFDIFISFVALLVLSPVVIVITIGLYIANNRKPFFLQPRPGKNERIFKVIKFKTMTDEKDEAGL
jgi:lipopolysaccharide/colanic/teichoic acid biosynthesis glycosyltransferase